MVWNNKSISKLYEKEKILDEPKRFDNKDNYVDEVWKNIFSNDEMKGKLMDYQKQKELLKRMNKQGEISDDEFKRRISECDKKLDEQAKRLVELFGKI